MTDKELRRLNRRELLKLLLAQGKELERVKALLQQANEKLDNRLLMLDQAGSIADAAVKVNQIFETAQKTADQYLESVQVLARRECSEMYEQTKMECAALLEEARQEASKIREKN